MQPQLLSVSETRKKTILEILNQHRKNHIIKSNLELQQEYLKYASKIDNNEPIYMARIQEDLTNPTNINLNFQEIDIEIKSIFSHIEKISNVISSHQQLNESLLIAMRIQMETLRDTIHRYESIFDMPHSHGVHVESFTNYKNFESEQKYYTTRFGRKISEEFRAEVDHGLQGICLPVLSRNNILISQNGEKLATVKIVKQIGQSLTNSTLGNILDSSTNMLWHEQVVCDEPIVAQSGDKQQPGALCEIKIDFGRTVRFNEIHLTPFTEYPMDIVSIVAFQNKDSSDQGMSIISPDVVDHTLRSAFTADKIAYKFPHIDAAALLITLIQRHYSKTSIEIEEKISIEEIPLGPELILPSLKDNIFEKYQYNYGLTNVSIFNNERASIGIYVSNPIKIDGNVYSLQISTKDTQATLNIDNDITSVEYYVTSKQNPEEQDWLSILPITSHSVQSELLQPIFSNNQYIATTRFPLVSLESLMINNVPVHTGFNIINNSIIFNDMVLGAVYTINYQTSEVAKILDPISLYVNNNEGIVPNIQVIELAGIPSNKTLSLPNYVYVDRKKILSMPHNYNPSILSDINNPNHYVPIKIRIIDSNGNQIDQPSDALNIRQPRIENVTDYFETGNIKMTPFIASRPIYMYRVEGNKIHFNTAVPSSSKILIEYPHLSNIFRIKAILRRNFPEQYWATPVVQRLALAYKILR